MSARKLSSALLALAVAAAPLAAGAQTTIVYGPGTTFTSPLPSPGASDASCSAAADTWCARNVRNNAEVGITTDYARSGNGSIYFNGSGGGAKADMERYFSTPFTLGSLTEMSYDWYRDGSSTAAAHLVPSLRLILRSPVNNAYLGYLIYEPIYNELAPAQPAPTDAWQTSTIVGSSIFWRSANGGPPYASLSSWQSGANGGIDGNTLVVGLSTGIGSGWSGDFTGAVDNVSYTLDGDPAVTYNFEVTATPEPASIALMGTGLLALGAVARRRRKA